MTVKGKTGGIGTAAISRDYPVEEGLELGTTKIEGKKPHLKAEQDLTRTSKRGL